MSIQVTSIITFSKHQFHRPVTLVVIQVEELNVSHHHLLLQVLFFTAASSFLFCLPAVPSKTDASFNFFPAVLLDLDSASSIHTMYADINGLLLALVELKYQAMNTSPFNDHPAVMQLFLIAITVYVMALLVLRSNHQIHAMMIWVCRFCGSLACELLLLLLVSPIWCFIINLSSLLLLLTFLLCCHFFFQPSQSEEGQASQVTDQAATIPSP